MIRKTFKKVGKTKKLKPFLKKHNIPVEYLSVTRRMTAKAVFIGLFIAFIPMPMQMLAVVLMIPLLKFNVPIALAICWFSNPLTMPFIYYIEYLTGSFILNIDVTNVQMSVDWFSQNFESIFIPLYVGALFYSTIFASIAFYLINYFWKASVHKNKKLNFKNRK